MSAQNFSILFSFFSFYLFFHQNHAKHWVTSYGCIFPGTTLITSAQSSPLQMAKLAEGNIFCHFALKVKVLVSQSGLTLCDPMDCSLPSSSVQGTFQVRILEWVAIPFFRGSSRPRDRMQVFCIAGRFFTIWITKEALIENEKTNHKQRRYLQIKNLITHLIKDLHLKYLKNT